MKATAQEVREEIAKTWPTTWPRLKRNTWLFDMHYWLPTREEIEKFLDESRVDRMKYISEISDCDDRALQLYSEAKRVRSIMAEYQEIPREEWFSWPLGRAMGMEFRGMRMPHSVNFVRTRDSGLLMIEPEDDRIWEPKESHDKPFFLES